MTPSDRVVYLSYMGDDPGQSKKSRNQTSITNNTDFVLEKGIFSSVFDKDIQRVYIYKKAERLAKAIHTVGPAFAYSPALRSRADTISIALVDAAILSPLQAREALSRELLALSSLLSIARVGGSLSSMNAEIIGREAQLFLQEIAAYEAPRIALEDTPTLSALALETRRLPEASRKPALTHKGHIKDIEKKNDRKEAILSVIKDKGNVYIKDISKVVRGVSEKTIQRELAALVAGGSVVRRGERRWTLYSLA